MSSTDTQIESSMTSMTIITCSRRDFMQRFMMRLHDLVLRLTLLVWPFVLPSSKLPFTPHPLSPFVDAGCKCSLTSVFMSSSSMFVMMTSLLLLLVLLSMMIAAVLSSSVGFLSSGGVDRFIWLLLSLYVVMQLSGTIDSSSAAILNLKKMSINQIDFLIE